MREEVKRWIEKAEKDLDAAEYLFKGKKYEECSLFCQQSVEKALKSVLLNRTNKIIKILFILCIFFHPIYFKKYLNYYS